MRETRKLLPCWILSLAALTIAVQSAGAQEVESPNKRLERKMAALRASGEPTKIAELEPTRPQPAFNADTYLDRARGEIAAIEGDILVAEGTLSDAELKAFEASRPLAGMQDKLRAIVTAHAGAYPLVEEASRCPFYDMGLDYTLSPNDFLSAQLERFQFWRATVRALSYRMMVQLADGERDAALETCLTMFRLTRLFETSPLFVSQLLVAALRSVAVADTNLVLQSGPLSTTARAALDAELALQDVWTPFRRSLREERAFSLAAFENLTSGPLGLLRQLQPSVKDDMCGVLDAMQTAIDTDPLPFGKWHDEIDVPEPARPLAQLMRNSLLQMHIRFTREVAQLRSLRVLNAIQARGQKKGQVALDELGLPAEVTVDPFNDKPLVVKSTPGGWLVYSVGDDLKDDGGDIESHVDVGIGPLPALPVADAPADEAATDKSDADGAEPKSETEQPIR